jgi:hypothetical protein
MSLETCVLLTRSLQRKFLLNRIILSCICQNEIRVDAICEIQGLLPTDVFFEYQC